MDISVIRQRYNDGYYSVPSVPYRRLLPDNHIFDEDKTIKENREMVQEYNKQIKEERENVRKKENEKFKELDNDCLSFLFEYGFNKTTAQKIFDYVYSNYHSCISDMLIYLEEVADLVDDCIRSQKQGMS